MKKAEARRQHMLEQIVDHLLVHGLQGASLRPLAAAAGTSDRMLLHYFADKEELLTAALTMVTQRLLTLLDHARADAMPFHDLLPQLSLLIKDPGIQPYLRLWLELVAFATGEKEPYRSVAREICATFLDWIASALRVETEEERAPLAALTLAIIEGMVLFEALGDDSLRTTVLAGVSLLAQPTA